MSSEKSPQNLLAEATPPRLQLSSVQIVASALAAVTATIAGSFLGVNGTVIGAAVASVLTVTANAIYTHSLRRTGERVRTAPRGWRRFGVATTALFVSVLAVVTTIEVASGRPVSDLLRGRSGSGTSVFGASDGGALTRPASVTSGAPTNPPAVTITRTVVPKVVISTPTVTRTAPAVTVTPTPSTTGSAQGETPSPSPSASGGPTP